MEPNLMAVHSMAALMATYVMATHIILAHTMAVLIWVAHVMAANSMAAHIRTTHAMAAHLILVHKAALIIAIHGIILPFHVPIITLSKLF
jgi:hypothetical protein